MTVLRKIGALNLFQNERKTLRLSVPLVQQSEEQSEVLQASRSEPRLVRFSGTFQVQTSGSGKRSPRRFARPATAASLRGARARVTDARVTSGRPLGGADTGHHVYATSSRAGAPLRDAH